jgi:ubiquinone/menaquinone biosynthesis C-methylase UbiE
MEQIEKDFHVFPMVELEVENIDADGFILDIGGGGEGIIGKVFGEKVVAIDINRKELEEAADGPLKIIMDARKLQFLESSFHTATAFFSLMYIKDQKDQQTVMSEISRILKPGGHFHLWDVDLSNRPDTNKEMYLVQLKCRVGEEVIETGYGQRWPARARGQAYYVTLGESVGFRCIRSKKIENLFYLHFIKD